MIEQEARVAAIEGDEALVVIARQTSCSGCQAKSGCGTSLVSDMFPSRQMTVRLSNSQQARVGDRVVVGLPESGLQLASLLLYGVPLLSLLVGAIGTQSLADSLGWGAEPAAIIGGLSGMALGLYAVRRLSQLRLWPVMRPVMLRRLAGTGITPDSLMSLQPQSPCTREK